MQALWRDSATLVGLGHDASDQFTGLVNEQHRRFIEQRARNSAALSGAPGNGAHLQQKAATIDRPNYKMRFITSGRL
jgi:hypothetical protein